MHLNNYQAQAMTTALPTARNLPYMVLGLASEAGEVAGKLKKALRDGWDDDRKRTEILSETADCLWYIAGICEVLDADLSYIAQADLDKLQGRQQRGTLTGSGDVR